MSGSTHRDAAVRRGAAVGPPAAPGRPPVGIVGNSSALGRLVADAVVVVFVPPLLTRGADGPGSLPSYPSPERAVLALARAARYTAWPGRSRKSPGGPMSTPAPPERSSAARSPGCEEAATSPPGRRRNYWRRTASTCWPSGRRPAGTTPWRRSGRGSGWTCPTARPSRRRTTASPATGRSSRSRWRLRACPRPLRCTTAPASRRWSPSAWPERPASGSVSGLPGHAVVRR